MRDLFFKVLANNSGSLIKDDQEWRIVNGVNPNYKELQMRHLDSSGIPITEFTTVEVYKVS